MLKGKDIKDYLLKDMKAPQSGKSSFWEEHLRDFSFTEKEGLKGLKLFGSITQRSWEVRLFHLFMQIPYKKKAKHFQGFREVLRAAKYVSQIQNRTLDLDILRQLLTVAFCQEKIPQFNAEGKLNVVIGDGFGVLSSLIHLCTLNKVFSVNLNEILLVDYLYTRGIIADESTALAKTESDIEEILKDRTIKLIYIQAENHSLLRRLPIHVAFNIASMQEMNPSVIEQYFDDLRNCSSKDLYFYCCNRTEKTLPDGTLIRFLDYPWHDDDEILIDELCSWHQTFYTSRPPFNRRYDGSTQHRLTKFNNSI